MPGLGAGGRPPTDEAVVCRSPALDLAVLQQGGHARGPGRQRTLRPAIRRADGGRGKPGKAPGGAWPGAVSAAVTLPCDARRLST